ncbi:MAG: toxin [Parcubacteria group bacterium CG_4_9_14_0_2_um_filter_41_8]|nr:MAG: toxin [Parcubacteria group bacterium CG11_big_fil_rev_8_21_14_0_20_41_14]PIR57061.1 MAG: toxin [Parcubacteria group bacterium CG10_big_fil_rev_8_21_14_0_10_41_35]PJC40361.1 MAG: toxin [Parcubacteria group bacterium CG_4_9_14_0_2_um_filter_41_8]
MENYDWNKDKNEQLIKDRGIGFHDVVDAIHAGRALDLIYHPNSKKYSGQKIVIVEINKYAYRVPFVFDDKKIFFKTIIPCRKTTKKYVKK